MGILVFVLDYEVGFVLFLVCEDLDFFFEGKGFDFVVLLEFLLVVVCS